MAVSKKTLEEQQRRKHQPVAMDTMVHIKISTDDRDLIQWAANQRGLTLSSYMRMLALKDAKSMK